MRQAVHRKESEEPGPHLSTALLDVERHLQALGDAARAQSFAELRAGLDQPELRVVVFGEFNRGKSTLINALLGRIVLPAKLIPTTGHVTQVVYGRREGVRVQLVDGRVETSGLDSLDSISSLDLGGAAREDVELVEVAVDHPLLHRKIALIDTPGLNEKAAQTRRARAALARADLVMLVLDARTLLNLRERDLATEWLRDQLGKPVVLVVNFMSFLSHQESREVRERLGAWTKSHFTAVLDRPWFEVNARAALLHALSEGAAPADDFGLLRSALEACEGKPREAIQRQGRHGQIRAEVSMAQAENGEVLWSLRKDVKAVEAERAVRKRGLEESIRRLAADGAARRGGILLAAQQSLASRLSALVDIWFKGESRERLDQEAARWYEMKMSEAVAEIEAHATAALRTLQAGTEHSAPLTLRERLVLSARSELTNLPATAASESALNWGTGLGAAVGTFILPGVGTAIGAALGRWLAGRSAADPVPLFAARARERWAVDAQKVMTVLTGQIDARIGEHQSELARQLEAAQRLTAKHARTRGEVGHREDLDAALDVCAGLLRGGEEI
jgi:small GTP-binding protein